MSILRFLYQSLCGFLHIKDRKHIEQNFHSVAGVLPQGWDLGVLGGSFFLSFSIYCLALAFEHYQQVYIVHSGLQDESLQATRKRMKRMADRVDVDFAPP